MKKILPIVLVVALVSMAAAGGAVWYLGQNKTPAGQGGVKQDQPVVDKRKYKYVNVEKVIVMLRAEQDTNRHYLSTDLVFKAPIEQEKAAKEQVPLLRSIAVRALSAYSFEKASALTIDQISTDMNQAYEAVFQDNPDAKPFTEVLIGKLIIE